MSTKYKGTYDNFGSNIRPSEPEPYRSGCIVGEDKLDNDNDTASPTTNIFETRLLINSTIFDSQMGLNFYYVDLKDFFDQINGRCRVYEDTFGFHSWRYNRKYNLKVLEYDGYVYVKVQKDIYGMKDATMLVDH